MAQGARPALGLSIGATTLAAVTADHAISRKPVLTLYRQRFGQQLEVATTDQILHNWN